MPIRCLIFVVKFFYGIFGRFREWRIFWCARNPQHLRALFIGPAFCLTIKKPTSAQMTVQLILQVEIFGKGLAR